MKTTMTLVVFAMIWGSSSAQAHTSWTDHCKPMQVALMQAAKDYPSEVFDRAKSDVKPQEGSVIRDEDETVFFVKLKNTVGRDRRYVVRMAMNPEANSHRTACRMVEVRQTSSASAPSARSTQ